MYSNLVVIRTGVKRISLQRGICSKIAYGMESSLDELHVLFQNQLWFEQKCQTDRMFEESFGRDLETLSYILKQTNFSRGATEGAIGSLKLKLLDKLERFLYPKRNMGHIELLIRKSFYTRSYKEEGVETKSLPPKRYIGIGYRDKGTAREPEKDASPKWQEVASYVSNLERQVNEYVEELKGFKGEPITRLHIVKRLNQLLQEIQRVRNSPANSGDAKTPQR